MCVWGGEGGREPWKTCIVVVVRCLGRWVGGGAFIAESGYFPLIDEILIRAQGGQSYKLCVQCLINRHVWLCVYVGLFLNPDRISTIFVHLNIFYQCRRTFNMHRHVTHRTWVLWLMRKIAY